MRYSGLKELSDSRVLGAAKGPVAVIIAEDEAEVASTLRHHRDRGFRTILLFAPEALDLPDGDLPEMFRIDFATLKEGATVEIVNAVNRALPEGAWLFYCYNAEYLFYPFAETRSVGELLAFHAEERRAAMLSYVIDAYAGDLGRAPDGVAPDDTWFDQTGFYALDRQGETGPKDRQLDIFGGLRWRFEEHIPPARRRIDRIAIVRARRDIRLRPDHTWTDEELNTHACPWHRNLTAAIVSFRAAKALRSNPASRHAIPAFRWQHSGRFGWTSQELMELGFIEPGHWY